MSAGRTTIRRWSGASGVLGRRFNPLTLSPALLLDSLTPNSLWQDTAGTTPAGIGDPVRQWSDLSGNGRHFTEPTTNPTLTANGITFDGVDDGMQWIAGSSFSVPAQTTIAVARPRTGIAGFARLFTQTLGAVDDTLSFKYIPLVLNGTSTQIGAELQSVGGTLSPVSIIANTRSVFTSRHTGTAHTTFINQTSGTPHVHNLTAVTRDRWAIGKRYNASGGVGAWDITFVATWLRALSDDELNLMRSYLYGRFAVTP